MGQLFIGRHALDVGDTALSVHVEHMVEGAHINPPSAGLQTTTKEV